MEPDDALWQLLGKAPRKQASGWFVARALAKCRQTKPENSWFNAVFWKWATGTGLAMTAVIAFYVVSFNSVSSDSIDLTDTLIYSSDNHMDSDDDFWFDEIG